MTTHPWRPPPNAITAGQRPRAEPVALTPHRRSGLPRCASHHQATVEPLAWTTHEATGSGRLASRNPFEFTLQCVCEDKLKLELKPRCASHHQAKPVGCGVRSAVLARVGHSSGSAGRLPGRESDDSPWGGLVATPVDALASAAYPMALRSSPARGEADAMARTCAECQC